MVRVGLISDTHDEVVPWDQVRERVADALSGVSLILHCGDLTTTGILDHLESIAPVVAVRSGADPPAAPPRLLDGPHVLEAGGVAIGLVNTLQEGRDVPFGREVAVVVHGGTHEASIEQLDGVLYVNPGSPTLAEAVSVGVLELDGGQPSAVIVRI
jgi:uncharacterized protein